MNEQWRYAVSVHLKVVVDNQVFAQTIPLALAIHLLVLLHRGGVLYFEWSEQDVVRRSCAQTAHSSENHANF